MPLLGDAGVIAPAFLRSGSRALLVGLWDDELRLLDLDPPGSWAMGGHCSVRIEWGPAGYARVSIYPDNWRAFTDERMRPVREALAVLEVRARGSAGDHVPDFHLDRADVVAALVEHGVWDRGSVRKPEPANA